MERAQEAAQAGDSEATTAALAEMDDAVSFPVADGVQYRSKWCFEIVDEDKVPRDYCKPDLKLIGSIVAHRKSNADIPGVRVYEETVVASKSA
jgi:hypothetical protein